MKQLEYRLVHLTDHNRDGSKKTQADRRRMLRLMGRQLVALGYAQLQPQDLRRKHGHLLVALWQEQGVSPGVQDNRMAVLRWVSEKIGRPALFPPTNAAMGIAPRLRAGAASKAKVLSPQQLAQVTDVYIATSLRLIQAYGLRRKESLMLQPHPADGGQELRLLKNWAKNGRPRTIPIVTPFQREVLDAAKAVVPHPGASLIPEALQYKEQEDKFDAWVQRIGLGGAHGLRHAWAQARYEALSGLVCPVRGGLPWVLMTEAQRRQDVEARQQLTRELGHERLSEVSTYIGTNRPKPARQRVTDES